LTLNGRQHSFQVADCRLQPEELPSGFVRDIWVSAAGTMDGKPYFLTLSRAREGKRSNVSLGVFLAPLPAALQVGGYNPNSAAGVDAMGIVDNASSLRSMGLAGLQYDGIQVQGRRLETPGAFKLQPFDRGTFADAPPVEARIELSCGG